MVQNARTDVPKPVEILGPLITSDPVPRRNEHGEREKAKREEDLRPWIAGMKLWLHEQATDAESALEHARVEDDAEATSEYVQPPHSMLLWGANQQ